MRGHSCGGVRGSGELRVGVGEMGHREFKNCMRDSWRGSLAWPVRSDVVVCCALDHKACHVPDDSS